MICVVLCLLRLRWLGTREASSTGDALHDDSSVQGKNAGLHVRRLRPPPVIGRDSSSSGSSPLSEADLQRTTRPSGSADAEARLRSQVLRRRWVKAVASDPAWSARSSNLGPR